MELNSLIIKNIMRKSDGSGKMNLSDHKGRKDLDEITFTIGNA